MLFKKVAMFLKKGEISLEKGEMSLEKVYILLTRWLTITVATLAFLFVAGGIFYMGALYVKSNDMHYDKETYTPKNPSVGFDGLMEEEKKILKKRLAIKNYVAKVIKEGSVGHGYSIGPMAAGIVIGTDTVEISEYIANGMEGKQPQTYSEACSACHGMYGQGNSGMSPNLKTLPIYNGLVPLVKKVGKTQKNTSSSVIIPKVNPDELKYSVKKTDQERLIYKFTENINRYAFMAGQKGISSENAKWAFNEAPDDMKKAYNEGLVEISEGLLEYAKSLKEDNKSLKDVPQWLAMLKRYDKEFKSHIEAEINKKNKVDAEQRRLKREKEEDAANAKIDLMMFVSTWGIVFGVFLLLTLVIVLIRIEKNTRRSLIQEKLDEEENEQ